MNGSPAPGRLTGHSGGVGFSANGQAAVPLLPRSAPFVLSVTMAVVLLSACSTPSDVTAEDQTTQRVKTDPFDMRGPDATCAEEPAQQERMVRLKPASPADAAARVDAGVNIAYTEYGRACVDAYLWVNTSPWKPERFTVTARDGSGGPQWSLHGTVDQVNSRDIVLPAGVGCVHFTGEVTARLGDKVATWRAAGQSQRC